MVSSMRHVLRDRRRLADSRLHLDPGAGRRFGLERTGEQMLGAAHRHTDAKKWHAACAQPLIQDERDELVYHCVAVIQASAGQDRVDYTSTLQSLSMDRRLFDWGALAGWAPKILEGDASLGVGGLFQLCQAFSDDFARLKGLG